MAIKDAYSTAELAPLLGYKNKRNVLDRAAREGWQSRPRPGRGGGKEWIVSSMPEATRIQIVKAVAESSVPAPITSSDVVIPDWANSIGLARFRLVMEWRGYCAKSKQTKAEASATFELSYRTGHLLPKVYEQLGEVAVKTIYRWDIRLCVTSAVHGQEEARRGLDKSAKRRRRCSSGLGCIRTSPV